MGHNNSKPRWEGKSKVSKQQTKEDPIVSDSMNIKSNHLNHPCASLSLSATSPVQDKLGQKIDKESDKAANGIGLVNNSNDVLAGILEELENPAAFGAADGFRCSKVFQKKSMERSDITGQIKNSTNFLAAQYE